jgi:uncharacterized protein YegL
MTDIIQNGILQFASELPDSIRFAEYNGQDEVYGVLNFKTPTIEATTSPMLYHIMIDVSGSMSDILSDGRSKMQLITHTLTNILHHFAENTQNSYIQVTGFDDKIHSYIEPTKVTSKNLKSLISKLSPIRPMNMTDIELALTTLAGYVRNNKTNSIPYKNRVVIFLTDGDTTAGEVDPLKLSELIPNEISFHSIALGENHNSNIMYALGHRSSYTTNWFINQLEHTGNVYGEILFNETHRMLDNAIIHVNNGRIFDYSSGEFVSELHIGILSSELNKQYHIMSDNPSACSVCIQGIDVNHGTHMEFHAIDMSSLIQCNKMNSDDAEFNTHFIKKQYMRLGVQKLMADLRLCSELKDIRPRIAISIFQEYSERITDINKNNNQLRNNFNIRAKNMKKSIIKYIDDNILNEDSLLYGLIDDLNVFIKTTSNPHVNMKYATAREESQGNQTVYNTVSDMQDNSDDDTMLNNLRPPKLRREPTSAYATPGRLNIMRELSHDNHDDDEFTIRTPPPAIIAPFEEDESQLNLYPIFPSMNSP